MFEPVHGAVFNTIHRQRKRLSSPEAVRAVFVENGVDAKDFDRAFGSFGIDSMVRQAAARTEGARVQGTPHSWSMESTASIRGRRAARRTC